MITITNTTCQSIHLPRRGRGRQSAAKQQQFETELQVFADNIKLIRSKVSISHHRHEDGATS